MPDKVLITFDDNDLKQLHDLFSWIKELISILEKNLDDVRKDDEP